MSDRLSEAAARKIAPDTFRTGLWRGKDGKPNAVAMHVTFKELDQPPLILLIGLAAIPAIVAQLVDLLDDAEEVLDG